MDPRWGLHTPVGPDVSESQIFGAPSDEGRGRSRSPRGPPSPSEGCAAAEPGTSGPSGGADAFVAAVIANSRPCTQPRVEDGDRRSPTPRSQLRDRPVEEARVVLLKVVRKVIVKDIITELLPSGQTRVRKQTTETITPYPADPRHVKCNWCGKQLRADEYSSEHDGGSDSD